MTAVSVGVAVTKADLDQVAGSVARQVFVVFQNIQQVRWWLDATPDTTLTDATGPYKYTANEVAVLKQAFWDLDLLRQVFEGTATQTSLNDFRAYVKQLAGILR